MRVKGHNPDLDLLAGLISGPVRLDKSGKALGVQVQLGLVDKHLSLAIVAVDLQYKLMPVGDIIHMDLWGWKQSKSRCLPRLGCLNLMLCDFLWLQNFK